MPDVKVASSPVPPLAIEAIGLRKTLNDRLVLNGIDLSIPAGQYVAVLGINGAGKTTLLKILATLTSPSAGQLKVFGFAVPKYSSAARRWLGLIGHQSMLYRDLTARENLELFAKLYGIHDPAARAEELLRIVGLTARADDPDRKSVV